jgi:hypothetical protein
MPDSTLSRRSAALLRVDLGDRRSIRGMNFTRKLQKTPKVSQDFAQPSMLEELSAILRFPKLAHVYSADFGGLKPTVSWNCSSEKSCSPRMGHHMGSITGRG